jgi:heterodisulfide reductase subunit A-like polyferredoxin
MLTSAPVACSVKWLAATKITAFSTRHSRVSRFSNFITPARKSRTPAPNVTKPGACTIACPFGTVNYVQQTGKVQKCDLCYDNVAGPACVEACPTSAITYVDANWTGLDRMRQWADKLGNTTTA